MKIRARFIIVVLALLYLIQKGKAQTTGNLVPNPSFEDTIQCPIMPSDILSNINNWYNYDVSTTDYYHSCYGVTINNVYMQVMPRYRAGIQWPLDGEAYVGIAAASNISVSPNNEDYREFISVKLKQKLNLNKLYCGSFYTSYGEYSGFIIDALGMYFTQDSLFAPLTGPPNFDLPHWNYQPQIQNKNGIINDTLNWIKIEGSFTSDGTEQFVHLGNFKEYGNFILVNNSPLLITSSCAPYAYYIIDDVSLVELTKFPQIISKSYDCSAKTITFTADTGFNFRWYLLPDTNNLLSSSDTFMVDASSEKNVLLKATLCSTEFTDTLLVPKLDCTGIEDNALAQGAALFPNPASQFVNFSLQGIPPPGTFLQIADLNGKMLYKQNVTGKNTEVDVG